MWIMNKYFETAEQRLFALLPLSHGFVPGACLHIDTDALCAIVGGKHNELLAHYYKAKQPAGGGGKRHPGRDTSLEAMKTKDLAWNAFFNVKKAVRTPNEFKRFGHFITTDGVSVSINIAHAAAVADCHAAVKMPKVPTGRSRRAAALPPHIAPDGDLSEAEHVALRQFVNANPLQVVGIDPGKRNLLYVDKSTRT
jgi:hypothetical protein